MSIIILDYGLGNVGSISNMLKHINVRHSIESTDKSKIFSAKGLILPGVGNFSRAMSILESSGVGEIIREAVLVKKIPILGICLGMQLMCKHSEEGNIAGLGLIDADVVKFSKDSSNKLKIPHMGWSYVDIVKDTILTSGLLKNPRYYFVHSYFVKCNDKSDILMSCNHGDDFTACFVKENIMGCQFHPEKSHKFGIDLFQNFVDWCR
tara:strand:+ start:305 stop:928 length:624 start_codon:yes stop_codon:yes gene_type:complete